MAHRIFMARIPAVTHPAPSSTSAVAIDVDAGLSEAMKGWNVLGVSTTATPEGDLMMTVLGWRR